MTRRRHWLKSLVLVAVVTLLAGQVNIAAAKVDCGPVTNKSNELPRVAAIGTNPAGTGAHAIAASLAAMGARQRQ